MHWQKDADTLYKLSVQVSTWGNAQGLARLLVVTQLSSRSTSPLSVIKPSFQRKCKSDAKGAGPTSSTFDGIYSQVYLCPVTELPRVWTISNFSEVNTLDTSCWLRASRRVTAGDNCPNDLIQDWAEAASVSRKVGSAGLTHRKMDFVPG